MSSTRRRSSASSSQQAAVPFTPPLADLPLSTPPGLSHDLLRIRQSLLKILPEGHRSLVNGYMLAFHESYCDSSAVISKLTPDELRELGIEVGHRCLISELALELSQSVSPPEKYRTQQPGTLVAPEILLEQCSPRVEDSIDPPESKARVDISDGASTASRATCASPRTKQQVVVVEPSSAEGDDQRRRSEPSEIGGNLGMPVFLVTNPSTRFEGDGDPEEDDGSMLKPGPLNVGKRLSISSAMSDSSSQMPASGDVSAPQSVPHSGHGSSRDLRAAAAPRSFYTSRVSHLGGGGPNDGPVHRRLISHRSIVRQRSTVARPSARRPVQSSSLRAAGSFLHGINVEEDDQLGMMDAALHTSVFVDDELQDAEWGESSPSTNACQKDNFCARSPKAGVSPKAGAAGGRAHPVATILSAHELIARHEGQNVITERTTSEEVEWLSISGKRPSIGLFLAEMERIRQHNGFPPDYDNLFLEQNSMPDLILDDTDYDTFALRIRIPDLADEFGTSVTTISNRVCFTVNRVSRLIITYHACDTDPFDGFQREWESGRHALSGVERIAETMIRRVLRTYHKGVAVLRKDFDSIESGPLSHVLDDTERVQRLSLIAKKAAVYKRCADANQEAVIDLESVEWMAPYVKSVCDMLNTVGSMSEEIAHNALASIDLIIALSEFKSNTNLKTFTYMTILLQPVSVATSWYGMNWANMPELEYEVGYYAFAAIAWFLAFALFAYFTVSKHVLENLAARIVNATGMGTKSERGGQQGFSRTSSVASRKGTGTPVSVSDDGPGTSWSRQSRKLSLHPKTSKLGCKLADQREDMSDADREDILEDGTAAGCPQSTTLAGESSSNLPNDELASTQEQNVRDAMHLAIPPSTRDLAADAVDDAATSSINAGSRSRTLRPENSDEHKERRSHCDDVVVINPLIAQREGLA